MSDMLKLPSSIESIYDDINNAVLGGRPIPFHVYARRIASEACRLQREADLIATTRPGDFAELVDTPLVVPEPK